MAVLLLGGFCVMAAWLMQGSKLHSPHSFSKVIARPQILVGMITATPHLRPSAFDEESGMSPAQLLNRWDAVISEASQRFHVPKAWIRAVMAHESGGRTMLARNQPMVSRAGAVGLMQVLPGTYEEMAAEHKLGSNPFEPRDNIMAGAAYLRWLKNKYGYPAMFAAYNAGPGRLQDHLENGVRLPAETRAYVGSIAKSLKLQVGKAGLNPAKPNFVKLTQPDGVTVKIDPSQVTGIRAALPGEYDWTVKTVLTLGKHQQRAVREDVAAATATIQAAVKAV